MSFAPFRPFDPLRAVGQPRLSAAVFQIAASSKYEASATATSHTVPMPTGTAIGDLLVITLATGRGDTVITSPTGFSATTLQNGQQIFWKVAEASDVSTAVFGLNFNIVAAAVAFRITGAHATDAVTAVVATGQDPPNLSSPWGTGNFIGITYYLASISHSAIGTVTVPSNSTFAIESSPSPSSTVVSYVCSASASLTGVAGWNPNTFGITGSTGGRRVGVVLIRPA